MSKAAQKDKQKGAPGKKRLGTVSTPPSRDAGDGRPLPSRGMALAIVAATVVLLGGGFWFLLSRHMAGPGWICFAGLVVALWSENKHLPGLRERTALRRAKRDARRLIKSVRHAFKKQKEWTGNDTRSRFDEALEKVESRLGSNDLAAIEVATAKLDELADKHLTRKAVAREYVEQIGGAVLAALLLRAFFYEAFRIPSGSMIPTLKVGDHLFVNKFTYGLRVPFTVTKIFARVPERGAVVVFNRPGDEHGDDIIKRVIGLPGEKVVVRNRRVSICSPEGLCKPLENETIGQVHLNGDGDAEKLTREGPFDTYVQFQETVDEHQHFSLAQMGRIDPRSEGEWVVKPGHIFVMGDNRDNSQDSRFGPERSGGFGQVPIGHVKGRADVIWLSIGGPHGLRFSRMFSLIH